MENALLIVFKVIWLAGSLSILIGLSLGAVVCARLAWQGNHYLYVHWTVASCIGIFATLHTLMSAGLW